MKAFVYFCCYLFFPSILRPDMVIASAILSPYTTGINYGQVADNLPSPDQVAGLLQANNIRKVRLYSANETVLRAFANTNIELIVGLGNEYIASMTDPNMASEWVNQNIKAYLPATKITGIAIGNEVLTGNDTSLMQSLLTAMQNIHSALVSIGEGMNITVSTAHSLAVLGNSFPPSSGSFRSDLSGMLKPLLNFLSQTGAPFFVNAYPYFAYKGNPSQVPLGYVLFQQDATVIDPNTGLRYYNMLHAQVDAVYSALSSLGYANVMVTVSETGWPSGGDPDEAGANAQNAETYNGNLIQLLAQNQGTPLRPKLVLQAYIFALFNEDMKPGPESERNYGLFEPNGSPVYNVGLVGTLPASSSSPGSFSTATSPSFGPSDSYSSSFSSAKATHLPASFIYLKLFELSFVFAGLCILL